jgi:glycerate kinase
MNILIAPNSFKECSDSVLIAKILRQKLSDKSDYNLIVKPLSDGGDGFLSIYESIYKVKSLSYYMKNSYNNELKEYRVLLNEKSKTIWIESAELFGLKVVIKSMLNPLKINSEVLGKLLLLIQKDVINNKIEVIEVFIGIGGTSTIDFGLGACSQLGLKLFDRNDKLLNPIPENYNKVKSYSFKNPKFSFKIKCIIDVDTNLFGKPGSIEIYGKQKGASDSDLILIKKGIKNIVNLISKVTEIIEPEKLNGAGGGLAAALNLFLGAELIRAEDFIKDYILKDIDTNNIEVVITGEGNLDFQSFEGKGVGVILNLFKYKNIPIFIICGSTSISENVHLSKNVSVISLMSFFKDKKESISKFEFGLAKAIEIIRNQLNI